MPFCSSDAECGPCGPCMLIGGGIGFCATTSNDSCDPGLYATPAVEIALLPGNAGSLTSSMNAANPDGASTTTHPALDGAIDHATEWAVAHPGHVVVVVLATDGDPTGSCNNDLNAINALAAAGAAGTPKILTFVIGVGGSVNALNNIAAAGGTTDAFMIDTEPDVQQAFLDALNEIQGAALPCSYLIPQPPDGEQLNYGQVNVSYTAAPRDTVRRPTPPDERHVNRDAGHSPSGQGGGSDVPGELGLATRTSGASSLASPHLRWGRPPRRGATRGAGPNLALGGPHAESLPRV